MEDPVVLATAVAHLGWRSATSAVGCLLLAALAGCTGSIGSDDPLGDDQTVVPAAGAGGETAAMQPTAAGGVGAMGGAASAGLDCSVPQATRAPLRRLTRFEYNNTVSALFGDTTSPGNALPSEELGNGFGNDADAQSVSGLLAEQYGGVAEDIATRFVNERLATALPCATTATDAVTETACARTLVDTLAPKAYRRPLEAGEADELVALFELLRVTGDFSTSIAGVIEALLQSPEFLYRPEHGVAEPGRTDLLRPTGYEMATRLSYLLWSTMPDDTLHAAAAAGELSTAEGVMTHAQRMLADPRARTGFRFFFDNLLPIVALSALERDATLYPAYTAQIGAYMREETLTFLEHQVFDGPGTWPSVFTADYTFVNEPLANFYGIAGVTGTAFQRVQLDPTKRKGLLTQAGMMAGTTHSNVTSPVIRGGFIVNKLLCLSIPLPTGDLLAEVTPPDPYSGATARERYSQHSQDPACAGCHVNMDPIGFALENFDPIGQWRDTENGVVIDASGEVPLLDGAFSGPVELADRLAASEKAQQCFASHWLSFAYGRSVKADPQDQCTASSVQTAFRDSGYNVKALLSALTQTEAFLYLPAVRE